MPITRNIDLPPTLISRFDLLYLVLDQVDEHVDRRLAQHLVSLYLEDAPETGGQDILVCLLAFCLVSNDILSFAISAITATGPAVCLHLLCSLPHPSRYYQ